MYKIYKDGKPIDMAVLVPDIYQAYDAIVKTFITGDLLKLQTYHGMVVVDYINPDEQHVYELVKMS